MTLEERVISIEVALKSLSLLVSIMEREGHASMLSTIREMNESFKDIACLPSMKILTPEQADLVASILDPHVRAKS